MTTTSHECRITLLDPQYDDRLALVKQLAREHGFTVTDRQVLTASSTDYDSLATHQYSLLTELQRHDYRVRNYKIESGYNAETLRIFKEDQ